MSSSGSGPFTARAISWDSVRRWGLRLTAEHLVSMNPEFVRWSRGARLAPGADTVLSQAAPLTITFAPDLTWDDATRLLASLGFLEDVEILMPPELGSSAPEDVGALLWTLAEPNDQGFVAATWGTETKRMTHGLLWCSNIEPAKLTTTFAEQLGTDATLALAMFRALQVHHEGMHTRKLFVTRSDGILRARSLDIWPRVIGQCTPEEALVIAGLLLRRRSPFHQRVARGAQLNTSAFDWYSGAAQLSLPRYLGLYAHLVSEAERADDSESTPLAYLEGVLMRVKHLIRVHDQLGLLHLLEAEDGANNDTVDRQTQHFYEAIDGVVGLFDGLSGLVAHLEGHLPTNSEEWRRVTFPELRAGQRPWVRDLKRYARVMAAAQRAGPRCSASRQVSGSSPFIGIQRAAL